jgi:3-oxoacyl-[acyl-carrier protein] reductase
MFTGEEMRADLTGHIALVAGGADGAGRAIADRLAENGASVTHADRDETDAAKIDAAIAALLARFGRLDILVNDATPDAMAAEPADIDQLSTDVWAQRLTGVLRTSHAAAAPMIARKSGRIINIVSVVGLVPVAQRSAHAAAQAGIVSLTRSMALDLAKHGILVNALAQGRMEDAPSLLSHIPLGRTATPREIANAALFLAAPASSYVTGHVLTVDGGWTAGFARDF